jgi:cytochrome c-type biogenesis protein CcmF
LIMDWQAPGGLLIWFAFATNLVAGIAFSFVARGKASVEPLARRSYHLFTVSTLLASAWLYVLFFTHNYAFKYVYEYSERSQPLFYIISAFWGGQEGTYLLWLLFNALFGYLILKKGAQYRYWGMTVFSVVNLFFLTLLVRLSPFAYLDHFEPDGAGLNPLLRDPWMVIHPPVMFIGYAVVALPFVIAIAALIKNDYTRWAKVAFPWVAVTALTLGAGNILGGFWAYKTLGWGGYWGWDPVENSSLVPWIISLALLHGMIIERRSSGLRKSNILLASFLFLLVIYGTFLTRSGVLSDFSVHSFADLGINGLLVGFLLFFVVSTALIFGYRARQIKSAPISYGFYGREFLLFAGLATLLLFGLVVLFWMSLPILTSAFSDTPRAADIATYNAFAQPMAVLIALLLVMSPFSNFAEFQIPGWKKKAALIGGLAFVAGVALALVAEKEQGVTAVTGALVVAGLGLALMRTSWLKSLAPGLAGGLLTFVISLAVGVREPLHLMFFSLAAVALVTNLQSMMTYLPANWKLAGGHLTHFGFAVMIIGVLASSAFSGSEKIVLAKGEAKPSGDLTITYKGLAGDIETPNNELFLTIISGHDTTQGRPQLYFSKRMGGLMKKPFIRRSLLSDIYFSPEDIKRPSNEPLVLNKGEKKSVAGMDLTFSGFEMGQHSGSDNSLRVSALFTAVINGSEFRLAPARVHQTGADGTQSVMNVCDSILLNGTSYHVEITSILADQGAVEIVIPGLTDSTNPETLILDVSTKPLINMVWAGAILIMLGTGLSFLRRRHESGQPELSAAATVPLTATPTRR